jgi:hypothetical protein
MFIITLACFLAFTSLTAADAALRRRAARSKRT